MGYFKIMSLKQKVMSGLYWTSLGKIIGQMITWGFTIYVIRLLEPSDYGLMALALVMVGFLTMLNELGIGAAIIQRKEIPEDTLEALFGLLILISILFYLLLFMMAPMISNYYSEPRLTMLIKVLSLQFLFMGFTVLPRSLLWREMAFKKLAWVEFFSAIAGSIVTLFLALRGYGVWSLVWGTLAIRVVSLVGLYIAKPFFHRPRFLIKGMGDFFSFGGYVTLSNVLWYFYITADVLIIGKLLGKDILGIYSVGLYLATLPMEKVSLLINQVAFPAFSTISSDLNIAGRHFLKAVRVLSCIAFPVLFGISSIAPELVNIFLGPKWSGAYLPVLIIAFSVPIRMIVNIINPTVFGLGYPEISFRNSLFGFVIMPIAFGIGTIWGLFGASMAWVIAFPIVFFDNMYRFLKILEINLIDVLQAMFKPFLSALIMVGFLQLLRLSHICGYSDILNLLVFILCGTGIYGGMMWRINRNGLKEITDLFRK